MTDDSGDLVKRSEGEPKEDKPKRTTTKRSAPPRKHAELDAIRQPLVGTWTMLGGSLQFITPLTGRAMIYQAEDATDALIEWAKTSPRVARALLATSKAGGAFGFVSAMAPVGIAAMVELGIINPDVARAILPEELAAMVQDRSEPPTDLPAEIPEKPEDLWAAPARQRREVG
jgi:hypothetical protein